MNPKEHRHTPINIADDTDRAPEDTNRHRKPLFSVQPSCHPCEFETQSITPRSTCKSGVHPNFKASFLPLFSRRFSSPPCLIESVTSGFQSSDSRHWVWIRCFKNQVLEVGISKINRRWLLEVCVCERERMLKVKGGGFIAKQICPGMKVVKEKWLVVVSGKVFSEEGGGWEGIGECERW
ncbi:unnamed protein product [Lactuca saligna]|uniref:Uncharacterized protein n=1 Tax=Lactuca saligna TaxID=75948 RepID=A0AA35ZWF7_LACSI|nr:unnamed protein product [Lactuca saligna]